jgi:hypothetical protein
MSFMFYDATSFNQNINMWPVLSVTNHADFVNNQPDQSNLDPSYIPNWVYP